MPRNRPSGSRTLVLGSVPIRTVPTAWLKVWILCRYQAMAPAFRSTRRAVRVRISPAARSRALWRNWIRSRGSPHRSGGSSRSSSTRFS